MPIPGVVTFPPPPPTPVDVGAYDFRLQRDGADPFVLNTAAGIEPQLGAQGLDGPAIDIASYTPPGWDGELATQVTAQAREVFLPLLLQAKDLMGLRALKQKLLAYCNPYLGPVTLRVGLPDSSARLITGIYRGGIDGTMDGDTWWVARQKLGIILRCGQPFWRSEDDWTVVWEQSDTTPALLPILPLAPANSNALGATNGVQVDGDVPTYPVWEITGPLESVEIRDVGTDQSFTFTASVDPGDTWTIDTRRGRQAVRAPDGTRQRSVLNPGAQLFPLRPGLSQIQTVVTGASSGAKVKGTAQILWLLA